MNDSDAAAIGRPTVWLTGAVALFGAVVASLIVGLRVANDGAEPLHENWWLVAWLVAGVVDAAVGVTLFARPDQRRLGGCLLVGGIVAVVVALATQAKGYSAAIAGGHMVDETSASCGVGVGRSPSGSSRRWCHGRSCSAFALVEAWRLSGGRAPR